MGNCGLRWELGGTVPEGGSHPPPPPNQMITSNSKKPINAYLFLAINGRGTSSGGGGSGDRSSGARDVHAAVCSSCGVGVAVSSVCWWSGRQQQWGHNCNGWQAASMHAAVGSGCGVRATACSGVACV